MKQNRAARPKSGVQPSVSGRSWLRDLVELSERSLWLDKHLDGLLSLSPSSDVDAIADVA